MNECDLRTILQSQSSRHVVFEFFAGLGIGLVREWVPPSRERLLAIGGAVTDSQTVQHLRAVVTSRAVGTDKCAAGDTGSPVHSLTSNGRLVTR